MNFQLTNKEKNMSEQCDHAYRNEFLNDEKKRTQKFNICGKERVYNPLNKKHILLSDPDIWSVWK